VLNKIDEHVLLFSEKFARQRDFWLNQLAGEIGETKIFSTGKKNPDCAKDTANLEILFPEDLCSRIMKLSKNSDISIYIILLVGLKTLIYRYTDNEDIILTSPVFAPYISEDTINRYVWIRDQVYGDITFKDLLFMVRQSLLEAYENQDYPFDRLLEELTSHLEIKNGKIISTVGCLLKNIHENHTEKEMGNQIVFSFARDESLLEGTVLFNPRVYERVDMEQVAAHFVRILQISTANINVKISDISFLTPREKKRLVLDFNATDSDYQLELIHRMVEQQVREQPDAAAVVFEDQFLSYNQLNRQSDELALRLIQKGIRRGKYVPVIMTRGLELLISLFAIMKTGAAFVPLDVNWPARRIHEIINDLGSDTAVVNKEVTNSTSLLPDFCPGVMVDSRTLGNAGEGKKPDIPVDLHDPIYVIYTSGSTGKAKGTVNLHKGIANRFLYMNKRYQCIKKDIVLLTSNHVFDAAVWQLFWPLINGIRTVIPAHSSVFDLENIITLIQKQGVTITDFVVPVFNNLVDLLESKPALKPKLRTLRQLLVGGEAMNPRRIYHFKSGFPQIGITNTYGPSETSIGTVFYEITHQYHEPIPIGRPINNVYTLILDKHLNPVPVGVPGELYLGGDCVGAGYLNDPEKTNRVFFNPGTVDFDRGIFYKTGDNARYLVNGHIEFLGRADHQVKIRGMRVELAEIENLLMTHQSVKEAVVIAKEEDYSQFLCAYTVPAAGSGETPKNQEEQGSQPQGKIIKYKELSLKDILEKGELAKLPDDYREPGHPSPGPSIIAEFEMHVREKPNEMAINSPGRSLTYYTLDQYANCISRVVLDKYDDRYSLSAQEKSRYERQMLLDGWGIEAQETLKRTTVFVSGAGGTGSATIFQLALAGIGTIIVCDHDQVELTNLGRVSLHDHSRIGMNKALSAKMTVNRINPDVKVIAFPGKITRENVAQWVGDSAVIFENTDDMEAQSILSEFAAARQIPHIFSSMIELSSFAVIFHTPLTPCLHCLYDMEKLREIEKIKIYVKNYQKRPFAVTASSLFLCTGFAVTEALKIILGFENPAYNRYMFFNQKASQNIVNTDGYKQLTYPFSSHFRRISKDQGFDWDVGWRGNFVEEIVIEPDPNCPVCGEKNQETLKSRYPAILTTPVIPAEPGEKKPQQAVAQEKNTNPRRQTVALLFSSQLDRTAAILGVLKSAKACVLMNPNYPEEKLLHILKDSEARLVLTCQEHLNLAIQLRDKVNKHIGILTTTEISERIPAGNPDIHCELHQAAAVTYLFESPAALMVSDLKNYLSGLLPAYMIPSYFTLIEKIPLSANGKLDRKALPEPFSSEGTAEICRPSTPIQERLARIWSEVLGIQQEKISIDDNFFEIGGHSLKATILGAKIHKEFKIKLSLIDLFKAPTIRGTADNIRTSTKMEYFSVEPLEMKEYYPLSSAQERLFFLKQLVQTSLNYNSTMIYLVRGKIQKEKLASIFHQLIKRHETLRTSFEMINGAPVQRINRETGFSIDIDETPKNDNKPEEIVKRFVRPFELDKAPLLRVGIVKLGQEKHILMVDMHHIITDGFSLSILIQEFAALYAGKDLPPLRLQYRDFSQWQNRLFASGEINKQEEHWLQEFPGEIPVLNLPLDYPAPAAQSFLGSTLYFSVPSTHTQALKSLAARTGATLQMVLLAIFNVLLSKICDQEDIIVGTSTAGRRHADLENTIGIFTNTLALRNHPTREKTFAEFLTEVKTNSLKAYDNQDYPFDHLVAKVLKNRTASGNPLFETMFEIREQAKTNRIVLGELELFPYEFETQATQINLDWIGYDQGEEIFFTVTYGSELFKKASVEKMIEHYREILDQVVANPGKKLEEVSISHDFLIAGSEGFQEDQGDFEF
jgi:amino acid adenylation domain-containing protein